MSLPITLLHPNRTILHFLKKFHQHRIENICPVLYLLVNLISYPYLPRLLNLISIDPYKPHRPDSISLNKRRRCCSSTFSSHVPLWALFFDFLYCKIAITMNIFHIIISIHHHLLQSLYLIALLLNNHLNTIKNYNQPQPEKYIHSVFSFTFSFGPYVP